MTQRPTNTFAKYHAHVYFDADSLALATTICTQAGELFGVAVGRIHQKPVGPHPCWSCQLSFDSSHFERLIPWLEHHRAQLTVFVHPSTDDDLTDHTTYAAWLGEPAVLNLSMFEKPAGKPSNVVAK